MLIVLLLLPLAAGGLLWLLRRRYAASLAVSLLFSLAHALCAYLVSAQKATILYPFAPYGFELAFRVDGVSGFFLMLTAVMFVLLAVYTTGFCRQKPWGGAYQLCLWISLTMMDGALLSDHLALMLFFWEGLLCTLFGMLLLRNREHPGTAVKALIVSGTADLLLMLGIALTIYQAGTGRISEIHRLPITGWSAVGCACLLLGALGKAGCMPFHSWIPDAASDAPTPFLAAFPGSLEKIVGISFATRIILWMFDFQPGSPASLCVMTLGAVTLLGGVILVLVQKDVKRLLAYHAISQVGYIVLGLGSALAVGMVGGVDHLLNNVLYKSGLFMMAGILETSAGTTDLHQLGGLRRKLPATTAAAIIFALSIAGFPGTNGFQSKEMIFDAALEIHPVFYVAALLGAIMTALSFLKLIRAAFFGPLQAPVADVREAKPTMLLPMLLLAAACLVCAVVPALPLDRWIGAAYGYSQSFASAPKSALMVTLSCVALGLAVADHVYGSKKTGSALGAADHIHTLPGLKQFYHVAERGVLDPYRWITGAADGFARLCVWIERGVSALYDTVIPNTARALGDALSRFDNGSLSRYLLLALAGLGVVALVFGLS